MLLKILKQIVPGRSDLPDKGDGCVSRVVNGESNGVIWVSLASEEVAGYWCVWISLEKWWLGVEKRP